MRYVYCCRCCLDFLALFLLSVLGSPASSLSTWPLMITQRPPALKSSTTLNGQCVQKGHFPIFDRYFHGYEVEIIE
jgi:hypothetical protein